MSRRAFHRHLLALLSAGAIAPACTAFGALVIDVRATHINGVNIGSTNTPKLVIEGYTTGDTITMSVWAQVTGSDPSKFHLLQSLSGSFLSFGDIHRANLAATGRAPWAAAGSSPGTIQDLDADGDLDVGSNFPAIDDDFFFARSDQPLGPNSTDDRGARIIPTGGVQNIFNGYEYRVGTLTYVMTAYFAGSYATVNFRPRFHVAAASWIENATQVETPSNDDPNIPVISYTGGTVWNPTTGVFGAGNPVSFAMPEPASLGIVALAMVALAFKRR